MSAKYWIAQHIDNLFRNEPRNVGVFVQEGTRTVARFFGEDPEGEIDGRRIRALSHPDVYRQWICYWRRELDERGLDPILALGGSNYRVISGGEVSDIGNDPLEDVVTYLYAMLVSEGGFREALAAAEQPQVAVTVPLNTEVSGALSLAQLLLSDERVPAIVPHPVFPGRLLNGTVARYTPAFTQENGRLYVMQTVDFTRGSKKAARDHAGWSAYMFHDIKQMHHRTDAIAIVKRCV